MGAGAGTAAGTHLTAGCCRAGPQHPPAVLRAALAPWHKVTFVTRELSTRRSHSVHVAETRALLGSGSQHLPQPHVCSFPTLLSPISPRYLINLLGQPETAD